MRVPTTYYIYIYILPLSFFPFSLPSPVLPSTSVTLSKAVDMIEARVRYLDLLALYRVTHGIEVSPIARKKRRTKKKKKKNG